MFKKRTRTIHPAELESDGLTLSATSLVSDKRPNLQTTAWADDRSESESDGESIITIVKPAGRPSRSATDDDTKTGVKRRKVDSSGLSVSYVGDRSSKLESTADATVAAPRMSPVTGQEEPHFRATDDDCSKSEVYTGVASYDRHAPAALRNKGSKHTTGTPKHSGSKGPVREVAGSAMRAITVIDYAPDVCKDYKQTGFCGFGDTCKFLHDRGDFKQGWQLDRDWEFTRQPSGKGSDSSKLNRKVLRQDGGDESVEQIDESVPFRCIICKDDYKSPIQTRCGHFFCEACAIARYRVDPTCAFCGTSTSGIFNGAKKLKRLLAARQQRIQAAD